MKHKTHTHIFKTEFVTSFLDLNISDFDLYILKKYLFIPLLVLCIPILWGPALQCGDLLFGKQTSALITLLRSHAGFCCMAGVRGKS
jgi:hypothetical protein